MPLPSLLPALFILQAPLQPPAPFLRAWPELQGWAGGKEAPAVFEAVQLHAFLEARRRDLGAGSRDPWKGWLESLVKAGSPELRAWARTRLVEAGSYGPYEELLRSAVAHLQDLSQPSSGKARLRQPPPSGGWMPGLFRIQADSPFWVEVERQTRAKPDFAVSSNLYALWCHGHHSGQRSLMYDIAARVAPTVGFGQPRAEVWNDPRFWIVADWALAWGSRQDFETLEHQLPDGPARGAWRLLRARLAEQELFWAGPLAPAELRQRNATLAAEAAGVEEGERPLKVLEEGQSSPPLQPARDRQLRTTIHLRVTVDPSGKVAGWRPYPGPWIGFFAATSGEGLAGWRFEPARVQGTARWAQTTLVLHPQARGTLPGLPEPQTRGRRGGNSSGW
ncbi:MAG: hypothetical protein HY823_03790 [Acidobacteria bacterium]|nr:hypothetical protein [Acidobacteriota bacterium]